jgi:prepilin-type processing-associated H-X9-DG protein
MRKKIVIRFSFTLIELLIVIAVITILISLLLPALAKTRMYGYSINCLANLRQTGSAVIMYTGDHNEYFPDISASTAIWQSGAPQTPAMKLEPYLPGPPSNGYASLPAVWKCAANRDLPKAWGAPGYEYCYESNYLLDSLWVTQSYPGYYGVAASHAAVKLPMVQNPTAKVAWTTDERTQSPPVMHGGRNINVSFIDGHSSRCNWATSASATQDSITSYDYILNPR